MRRALIFLFALIAVTTLFMALAPNVLRTIKNDNDPRMPCGIFTLILHQDDQVVVRMQNGSLYHVNYNPIMVYSFRCWIVSAFGLALAVKWPRRQRIPGTCAKCGYDLRASPTRCPECGTASDVT